MQGENHEIHCAVLTSNGMKTVDRDAIPDMPLSATPEDFVIDLLLYGTACIDLDAYLAGQRP